MAILREFRFGDISCTLKLLLPNVEAGKLDEIRSAISIEIKANKIRSPSNSEGRVRKSTPPIITSNLLRSLVVPFSTNPNRRAKESATVAIVIQRIAQVTPIARLKIAAASYLVPTPSRESAAMASSRSTGNASHQKIIVARGRINVQNARIDASQVRSLGNNPGEANL